MSQKQNKLWKDTEQDKKKPRSQTNLKREASEGRRQQYGKVGKKDNAEHGLGSLPSVHRST